jgi:uncharacterized protein YjbI with pentapeptide repeats
MTDKAAPTPPRAPLMLPPNCRDVTAEKAGTVIGIVGATAAANRTNLKGANLEDSGLIDAVLREANLKGANLPGADLSESRLSRAVLTGANLDGVNFKGTLMPDGTTHE